MTTLTTAAGAATPASKTYQELLALFGEWRAFERPPLRDGAPDYTANTFKRRHQELKTYEARLAAIDPRGWPVEQQVDYQLVRAEMNGLDFYIRVLQPWARDPAFYKSVFTEQSDTPAHEGPTHHAAIELWTYSFPLSARGQKKLSSELRTVRRCSRRRSSISPAMRATCGLRAPARCKSRSGPRSAGGEDAEQPAELSEAHARRAAGDDSVRGVARETGASQDGPLRSRQRELHLEPAQCASRATHLGGRSRSAQARAGARPCFAAPGRAAQSRSATTARDLEPEEYQRRANEAITKYLAFLKAKDILPVQDYMDPALRERIGEYVTGGDARFLRDREPS